MVVKEKRLRKYMGTVRKDAYKLNKEKKVGEECECPSCGTKFIKENYQQTFCKTKGGTICKDKYWNTVIPTKRDNRTRISPANRRYMERMISEHSYRDFEDEHPFSTEALGQW
jgi:hypothetical protein